MANNRAIVITGVGDYWGARLAQRLIQEPNCHIIGIDDKPPVKVIDGLDFIEAEIDNPLVPELLEREKVDVLCHLKFIETAEPNSSNHEKNIFNAVKVLEACGDAGVKNVIIRSSTSVYGARPNNSAFIKEDSPLRANGSMGYTRDLVDIERISEEYQKQFKGLTIYRFANIIGSTVDSPMTRFLRQERPYVLFGYDPVTQFIHEDDVAEAIAQGVMNPIPGVFNLGADGAMPLTRVMRLLKKKPLPLMHRVAYKKFSKRRRLFSRKRRIQPIEWDYLRYSWVADLTRMQEILGFYPRSTVEEALLEFAGKRQESISEGDQA